MASQEKISVYNLADLKNTSDDAIPNYLNSLKFQQSHRLTDVRLTLGFSALAIAGACLAWDYKFGFDSTKYYTAAAVALYSLLNGALTLWIFYVERGTIYEGTAPSGDKLRISTHSKKNEPVYNVTVEVVGKDGKKGETIEIKRPFTEWFDAAGHFVAAPFQSVLATGIPAVGRADPKRVMRADDKVKVEVGGTEYTPEMLAMLASSMQGAGVEASGAEPKSGKKGERRRKA
ncbi:microsomal signal peptidase 25 kDa subunit-domain-containing protein [Cercophora newfieldiana]|uniref:Signal peptidase complex subunit 2 n=1 Tax=Cercophora newfieldiana TaxID=92897 RepID=A0AA39YN34_9PEZI|nr:microsomal signal peptidase 25 kDa subunit-domain-containing protein [Cercophora newfieldiana]